MILDSSALVAILKDEPEAPELLQALGRDECILYSAASYLETSIVIDSLRDPALSNRFDALLERLHIQIEPVTAEQARIARQAYRDYGRGSGHPANLNFGDCFSYALARDKRQPILFKGEDFIHTDLRSALIGTGTEGRRD
jgi:ribonuclease VapC